MKITIHAILGIKRAIGQKKTEVDLPQDSTVEGFIVYLKKRWGDELSSHLFDANNGTILPHVRIMVNGQTIQYLQGMETVLKEGDEVLLLPPASGG
jgi:sulfur-carrier protein